MLLPVNPIATIKHISIKTHVWIFVTNKNLKGETGLVRYSIALEEYPEQSTDLCVKDSITNTQYSCHYYDANYSASLAAL